jgi:NAD(P)-dependent dehydrogenase (short-subunit alcohol dehydrogenase family)
LNASSADSTCSSTTPAWATGRSVDEIERTLLARVFDTNVFGLLLSCQAALRFASRHDARRRQLSPASSAAAAFPAGRRTPPARPRSSRSASRCACEWAHEKIAVCTLNPGLTATGFFDAQPNPSNLPDPDMSASAGAEQVALHVLALDRSPRPEVSLRAKWRLLAILSVIAPRTADRMLVERLGWKHKSAD